MDYKRFLQSKRITVESVGFEVDSDAINRNLFGWQRDIVRWALVRGRAALFEDCGLGKTVQQLEWASQVCRHTGGRVLLLTPCAVAQQTVREHAKFEIATPIKHVHAHAECIEGINVTNYERLHLFDCKAFDGVVLDESSILKSFTGTTKRKLIHSFANTRFRLACTATPAPNDLMELGNHSDFLGVMPSNEMLSVWFINDSMQVGKYRLRKHAVRDFWTWVASWAVCLATPEDLGADATGFNLPPLTVKEHIVEASVAPDGFLFGIGGVSATAVHREKRAALQDRADVVGKLVNADNDQWAIWCDTNYEADALKAVVCDAIEVRGSDTERHKEDAFEGFATGKYRNIITKADIAGFGLNWQHCHKTTWFAGYSYEKFYQAIRRLLRFGQVHPVECHVVMTDAEQSIADTLRRKESEHETMKAEMAHAMRDFQISSVYGKRTLKTYKPKERIAIPPWLQRTSSDKPAANTGKCTTAIAAT